MGTGELAKLSLKEMRSLVNVLVSAGNKRIRRLIKNQDKGIAPEALRGVMNTGGVFSAKGKDRNQLFRELVRARKFFDSPLSTVKGAMEERKRRERALYGETREERAKRMKAEKKKAERKKKSKKKSKGSGGGGGGSKRGHIEEPFEPSGAGNSPDIEEPFDPDGDNGSPDIDESFRPVAYDTDQWDPEEQLKNTFRAFRMFKSAYPALCKSANIDSDALLRMMGSYAQQGLSPDEAVAAAYDEIISQYEDMEEARYNADNWEWHDVF